MGDFGIVDSPYFWAIVVLTLAGALMLPPVVAIASEYLPWLYPRL